MARGLDHIVHAVHDLDAAAALYRALGFTVGARNIHPPAWGTQNHIVQFPGCFVELLTMADTTQLVPHGPRFFSFGAHNRDFLARGQGLAMLALEGSDATAEAENFRTADIGDFAPFNFERTAVRPDGTKVAVAFSLAFASNRLAPDIGFFTCWQHHPENFWNPEFQRHRNTAASIAGVVLVANDPSQHQTFLSAFTGEREQLAIPSGITLMTPRGEIQVMDPAAFAGQFGVLPPDTVRGARLAALRFTVHDFESAATLLRASGAPVHHRMGRVVFGPDAATGATLVFEPRR